MYKDFIQTKLYKKLHSKSHAIQRIDANNSNNNIFDSKWLIFLWFTKRYKID